MLYCKRFFCALFFLTLTVQAQDQASLQRGYKNAKDLFTLGKYELAMEAFKPLTKQESGNAFTEYATFYYALSAFKAGQENVARDMFLQLEQKHP